MMPTFVADHQGCMSDFQEDYFVIAQNGTPYGQYKQALRELMGRTTGMFEELYGEHGYYRAKMELEDLERAVAEGRGDVRRVQLDVAMKRSALVGIIMRMRETYREWLRFGNIAAQLKEMVGEITPERRRQLESEMWEWEFKKNAALDIMETGHLRRPSLRLIQVMPLEARDRIHRIINSEVEAAPGNKVSGVVGWYMRQRPLLADYDAIPLPDVDIRTVIPKIEEAVGRAQLESSAYVGLTQNTGDNHE